MSYRFAGIIDRYLLSGSEFTHKLRAVRAEQWTVPTPCAEWDVRHLVNHMTRGNLNYVSLLDGGSADDCLRPGTRTLWAAIRWVPTSGRCGSAPRRSGGRAPSSRLSTTLSAR
ncbi:maleylpyruvate isomerase N-terminal domain-containing protein [Streptomyces sp. NPDC007164]|uniref:maleylpyruvate isomerase N-terminal domain-containing protein n=1 Tax=Streptomyces sp. NPDC007164 TaxID=3156918 RepID=UPI0033F291BA